MQTSPTSLTVAALELAERWIAASAAGQTASEQRTTGRQATARIYVLDTRNRPIDVVAPIEEGDIWPEAYSRGVIWSPWTC